VKLSNLRTLQLVGSGALTSIIALAGTICVISLVPTVASAALLQDGGFESALVGNYAAPAPIGDGWTVTAGTMQILRSEYSAVPHSGLNFAYLDYGYDVNTLSQTFATIPGQSYRLSYYVADTVSNNDVLTVRFGGTIVYNGLAPKSGVASPSNYVLQTATIIASAGTTTVSFTGQYNGPAGNGTIVDDVTVSAVPEPATLSVLCSSGLVLWRSRYRKVYCKRGCITR
jgi:hypothetical protein